MSRAKFIQIAVSPNTNPDSGQPYNVLYALDSNGEIWWSNENREAWQRYASIEDNEIESKRRQEQEEIPF